MFLSVKNYPTCEFYAPPASVPCSGHICCIAVTAAATTKGVAKVFLCEKYPSGEKLSPVKFRLAEAATQGVTNGYSP